MWFPDLTGKTINDDSAFILHFWAELFGEDTPISYTPRLQDTLSLVEELADVGQRAEEDNRWQKHLSYINSELKKAAESDSVLNEKYPLAVLSISKLKDDSKNSQFRRTADVLKTQLTDYEKNIYSHLKETLADLPKAKDRVGKALKQIATRAIQNGFTREELRSVVSEKMFEQSPTTVTDQIIDSFQTKKVKRWTCILTIKGNSSEIEAMVASIGYRAMTNKERPIGESGTKLQENLKLLEKECSLQVIAYTDAHQSNEAVQKILEPLRRIIDIANFMHRTAQFKIYPFAHLETDGFKDVVDFDASSYAGIEPQHDAIDEAIKYQKSGLLGKLPKRIITSLEQHSVAHNSTDSKQRFVNLWVALETLVGHENDVNIIDNIINLVNPLIIHRRVNMVIKYLAINLNQFGFCNTISDPTGWFKNSKKGNIRRDELLLAMTNGADIPKVAETLSAITAAHPLLCNRIWRVFSELSDSKELLSSLKSSKLRSEWQLRRIYRVRNILVHSGFEMPHLTQLTTHLEYYYSLTLSRILHDFSIYSEWSIEKSFEHRRQLFQYLENGLENKTATVNDILQAGNDSLGNVKLWK